MHVPDNMYHPDSWRRTGQWIGQPPGLEEYELAFKTFLTLYSAGHSVTPQCIPKIVESAAHFTTAHNVDKTKVGSAGKFLEECIDFVAFSA